MFLKKVTRRSRFREAFHPLAAERARSARCGWSGSTAGILSSFFSVLEGGIYDVETGRVRLLESTGDRR